MKCYGCNKDVAFWRLHKIRLWELLTDELKAQINFESVKDVTREICEDCMGWKKS